MDISLLVYYGIFKINFAFEWLLCLTRYINIIITTLQKNSHHGCIWLSNKKKWIEALLIIKLYILTSLYWFIIVSLKSTLPLNGFCVSQGILILILQQYEIGHILWKFDRQMIFATRWTAVFKYSYTVSLLWLRDVSQRNVCGAYIAI